MKRVPGKSGLYDCVLIVTDHSDYDYAGIVRESQLVVDTRHATVVSRTRRSFAADAGLRSDFDFFRE
jgi:UDP-N-acetyl-D-mannosaminuronate dehydrogenase